MAETTDDIDRVLRSGPFNFSQATGFGKALFVGEGDLSFSLSLATSQTITANRITSTAFEETRQALTQVKQNAEKLVALGANAKFGVNAQPLRDTLGPTLFDLIVFQFPNVGSRSPKYGRNPNAILIRRCMAGAAGLLRRNRGNCHSSV